MHLDLPFIRQQFPGLNRDFIFMDNAGGAQVLEGVIKRTSDFFRNYYVQLGASYKISEEAGAKIDEATEQIAGFMNASNPSEIVIGPSSSMLLRILSICLARNWHPGDEIIVTNSDHEANVSPWTDLEKQGMVIKTWKLNPDTLRLELGDLEALLSYKTKLVAMVHVSNILGTINPIREAAALAHDAGALICVDGVAAAPHRCIDVQESDADFYCFSTYKTFGPHQAVLYGKYDLLHQLDGLNHYFFTRDDVPYKFQPGNVNFELTWAMGGIPDYFARLHDHLMPNDSDTNIRNKFYQSYDLMAIHEEQLANRLIEFLLTVSGIRIIGETTGSREVRVPTISFVSNRFKSSDIVQQVDPWNIGIRWGDFYAKKLIETLKLEAQDGVVRISMVHYNTLDEVDRLIEVLEPILKKIV
jgi:cysteine desulfurase family protein (TIGR01976 family)